MHLASIEGHFFWILEMKSISAPKGERIEHIFFIEMFRYDLHL